MFVCPKCKVPLENLRCRGCAREYTAHAGIPDFLTGEGEKSPPQIAAVYDTIYSAHENAFEDQGRGADFRAYFAALAADVAPGSLLEVGCGEGQLLAAMTHSPRSGIEPSLQALIRAKRRAAGVLAVATAEYLPFADGSFDAVTAVGVMEHFADTDAALKEIFRVLVPGGAYIALIHLEMSLGERVLQKFRDYLIPRPRPVRFVKWLAKKFYKLFRPIRQPQRRNNTVESASGCLQSSGFKMERVITRQSAPGAPLAGEHVVILVARRPV